MTWGICVLLALAVWAVFGQTIRYGFINYDDDIYVYDNPVVTGGLSPGNMVGVFFHNNGLDEWLPLTDLSHMLDWQLYGAKAGGHHLTNVLLHAATTILLFLVLHAMTKALWRSAFVAAVFAVHPLRVESVAWVAERKDVLSGLFFMLTLWAWMHHVHAQPTVKYGEEESLFSTLDPRHWTKGYYAALIFFALGLMSKNMLVTMPVILLLLDYWPLGRVSSATEVRGPLIHRWRGLLVEKVPFLLLSAVACVTTLVAQQVDVQVVHGLSLSWRVENAVMAYADYLGHMFYPVGLALLYPRPEMHLPWWRVGLSLLTLALVSIAVVAGCRRHRYLPVGWFWYLIMLLPVIDIMQAGNQTRADRYTYLPQIGLSILIAWGAVDLLGSWRHRRLVLAGAAVLILGSCMVMAHRQTTYWKDSVSIWTRTLACTPGSAIAHCNLGIALARQGKTAEAVQQFNEGLALNPDDAKTLDNLGKIFASAGQLDQAVRCFNQALQLNPEDVKTLNNLGATLVAEGKSDEAIQYFQRAVRLRPDYAEAYFNLGNALARQGKLDDAEQAYQQALQVKPDYAEASNNLERIVAAKEQTAGAAQYYEQAVEANPNNPDALNNWGVMLARQGKVDEAIQEFDRALELNPDDASTHNNLGMALQSEGKSNEAFQQFVQALNLARARNNSALVDSILARLKTLQPDAVQPQFETNQ